MNRFIYQPNKSLIEIRELNSKRGKQKEPVNKLLELAENFYPPRPKDSWKSDEFWLKLGYQYYEGELRSPMYIRNKIMSGSKCVYPE